MQCPVCKNIELEQKSYKAGALILDRCPGCNGAWFDKDELHLLLGRQSAGYFEIPRISQQSKSVDCPKCKEGMYDLCYPRTTVFIDMCKRCRGIWLDNNEWKEIHKVRSEKPVAAAVNPAVAVVSKVAAENQPTRQVHKTNASASYADDIPGVKGTLLRFIDRAIENLMHY